MRRKALDLSTTQLIAGGLATLAAAVGASFLGVYGTVLGAAFMSVVSTAGTALGQHYMDQGKQQIKERTHLYDAARGKAVARATAKAATSADPTRTMVLPVSDPNATRIDADPSATRLDLSPAETVADALAVEANHKAVERGAWWQALRETLAWAKRRWIMLAVSSVAVFAAVMAGITVMEKITDKPAAGWVGANDGRGTTWGNLGNRGGTGGTPTQAPSPGTPGETGEPTDAPTGGAGTSSEPEHESTPGSTADPQQPGGSTPQPSSEPTTPSTTEPSGTTNTEPSGTTNPGGDNNQPDGSGAQQQGTGE